MHVVVGNPCFHPLLNRSFDRLAHFVAGAQILHEDTNPPVPYTYVASMDPLDMETLICSGPLTYAIANLPVCGTESVPPATIPSRLPLCHRGSFLALVEMMRTDEDGCLPRAVRAAQLTFIVQRERGCPGRSSVASSEVERGMGRPSNAMAPRRVRLEGCHCGHPVVTPSCQETTNPTIQQTPTSNAMPVAFVDVTQSIVSHLEGCLATLGLRTAQRVQLGPQEIKWIAATKGNRAVWPLCGSVLHQRACVPCALQTRLSS